VKIKIVSDNGPEGAGNGESVHGVLGACKRSLDDMSTGTSGDKLRHKR